ncbi:SpaA isopeptide-forming pilin-related protein [Lactococcus lactis]|uniref:LPXTG cell wall anchor domain-containing protein n=1 Tax=Lactococcus lactis TaxID=1358 RepID=UPI00241894C1|nr:LPXTG cell wall anchor domain-containing protein [Lactococcus lactis]MDG4967160.1 SpaA isopeptide-forming pilin-related protein [Lactococcus lactis]
MKKKLKIFSLLLLIFSYLVVPTTEVVQARESRAQSITQTISTLHEEEKRSEATSISASNSSILQTIEYDKSGITNFSKAQPRAPSARVAGDDPGVTIKSPASISSSQLVEVEVTLAGSAGKLDKDGDIQVTIPKSSVRNQADLVNRLVIGDPFYLDNPPVTTDSNGDYILNIKYDHTKIDQTSAFGATFKILFQAPIYYDTDPTVPSHVDFNTNLSQNNSIVSTDSSKSDIIPAHTNLTVLSKWSTQPSKNVQGVKAAIMDEKSPNRNIFAIAVNYNQRTIKDAKIIDTTPKGTELADPNKYIPATGDAAIYKHFRIAKVSSRDSSGTPNGWEYVTQQFEKQITTTSTGFSISLGDLTPDDAYVIMYAEKINSPVTPDEFGVRYNHVELYTGETQLTSRDAALALNNDSYQALSLKKTVSQPTISTTDGFLEYALELKGISDVIKKGSTLTDPLPEKVQFVETIDKNNEYISDVKLDSDTNTVSYTVLKDIPTNLVQTIKFRVKYSDAHAKPGEEIVNRASINYAGTEVYSNTAVTALDGSAYLYKIDESSKALAGAEFKIIDSNGNFVKDGLVSDEGGFINSGLLNPGKYQFIEVKAPNGYELDNTPIDFEVIAGQETPLNLSKINKLSIPGDVILTKIDGRTGKTLEGAEFKLQDYLGRDIETNLISDSSGKIFVQGLYSGEYQFIETKAPKGYVLDTTPIIFNIQNAQTEVVQVTAKNKQVNGDVLLTKVDSKTNKALEGAVFELQDESGKTLQKYLITDSLGQISVKGLEPDNYQFVETKAPSNYKLDSTPLKFTISENSGKKLQVTKTNDRISEKKDTGKSSRDKGTEGFQQSLPSTGEKTTSILILIGILSVLAPLIYIFKNKAKKK